MRDFLYSFIVFKVVSLGLENPNFYLRYPLRQYALY